MKIRCYSELMLLSSFEDRFEYLRITEGAARYAFDMDRWINQDFYRSREWQDIRAEIFMRDEWDLSCEGFSLGKRPIIHHMNPITKRDIIERTEFLWNPEYLILCSKETHEGIHKGKLTSRDIEMMHSVERKPNDTTPWRR